MFKISGKRIFNTSLFFLIFLFINGCDTEPRNVEYRVTGGQFDWVTYKSDRHFAKATVSNATGGTEQYTIELPYTRKFKAKRGAFLYMSAQVTRENMWIQAEIYVDGKKIKSSRSSGDYVIANVSESCP